jgi:hypothetical protein
MENIKKSDDYNEKIDRVGNVTGWLDEMLEDVQNNLRKILNEDSVIIKNSKIKALSSYLSGVQDGNRFGKPNPFTDENPRLNDENGTRIIS